MCEVKSESHMKTACEKTSANRSLKVALLAASEQLFADVIRIQAKELFDLKRMKEDVALYWWRMYCAKFSTRELRFLNGLSS